MYPTLSDSEFDCFRRFILNAAGIHMSAAKKQLVAGRLGKRLKARGLSSFGAYYEVLQCGQDRQEVQTAVDLLTTNETYFFREPRHFQLLRQLAQDAAAASRPLTVWSAASSTGEEAYSIAMVLADLMPSLPWSVMGSDISQRVLDRARTGHYDLQRARQTPPEYLRRFCLRGHGEQEGTLLVRRELRQRVQFQQINLNEPLPSLGSFDLVFLRNVMIYFNGDTKRQVVQRVTSALASGGHLCIGHSESISDLATGLTLLAPSIYRKP
ncbi:CheR family methyltransferase [Eleftheria terrae]|uniref:CheR family methyltransferase n=1 Tax=Eleftheria terrae TaxID=1597781 RepID=UPI00263B8173|nr:protein-glutamate O-methyltransferase CheR [Eleftheria terrae]WKB50739.1 protein-glutamate O-methyltransferase CheR [Eleftheria terrae]